MRNSERLQHEVDSTLEEMETFLHDLSYTELPQSFRLRRQKLESKVKLLRAKHHLHLQRMPLSSLRFIRETFPKDLEAKRPRASTSPDHLYNFDSLPDVPEEDEILPAGTEHQQNKNTDSVRSKNQNVFRGMRPRSASFPLSL